VNQYQQTHKMSDMEIIAYTDGACSGNPGPGGWGALLIAKKDGEVLRKKTLTGGEAETTNNRMEMTAALEVLKTLERPTKIQIVTDSNYLKNGITQWIHGWRRNGWKTAAKKPVKNEDLWRALDEISQKHTITWDWVKGHAGHTENEEADGLANEGMKPFLKKKD